MATKPNPEQESGETASREVAPQENEGASDVVLLYQFAHVKDPRRRPTASTYHGAVPAADMTRGEVELHIRTKDALAALLDARTADDKPLYVVAEGRRIRLPEVLPNPRGENAEAG